MGPVSLNVRYRPLRIGWCIEADSLDHFSTAVALSHVFWGGRFNPIIPRSDRDLAEAPITAFNVDALYNVSATAAVDAFIKNSLISNGLSFTPSFSLIAFQASNRSSST